MYSTPIHNAYTRFENRPVFYSLIQWFVQPDFLVIHPCSSQNKEQKMRVVTDLKTVVFLHRGYTSSKTSRKVAWLVVGWHRLWHRWFGHSPALSARVWGGGLAWDTPIPLTNHHVIKKTKEKSGKRSGRRGTTFSFPFWDFTLKVHNTKKIGNNLYTSIVIVNNHRSKKLGLKYCWWHNFDAG